MRHPNSGLPEFGNIIVQVGNSRLGCAGPESITPTRGYGFRGRSFHSRPGMTSTMGNILLMDAISPSAIALKNVARRFVTPDGSVLSALEEFDLSIAPGEFFAIVGPTGCGKSTTLGLIAGLARPQAGSVTLFDAPVNGVDRRVGFVFQQDAVFPWRNVLGNVMAGPLFRGVPKGKAEELARDLINRVGLTGFEARH